MPSLDYLEELATQPKSVVLPIRWASKWKKDSLELQLYQPLCIDDVTIEGLYLRACCYEHLPGGKLLFQLEYAPAGLRARKLIRLEWKPLRGHNNKGKGPPEYQHLLMEGTHIHPFDLNAAEGEDALVNGNLKIAIPIEPEPATFQEVLTILGAHFNIGNATAIPEPPWSPVLNLAGI